jgi:hypothetical protein
MIINKLLQHIKSNTFIEDVEYGWRTHESVNVSGTGDTMEGWGMLNQKTHMRL